jgi:hypothetical protein
MVGAEGRMAVRADGHRVSDREAAKGVAELAAESAANGSSIDQ